jgi:hypothetical protein
MGKKGKGKKGGDGAGKLASLMASVVLAAGTGDAAGLRLLLTEAVGAPARSLDNSSGGAAGWGGLNAAAGHPADGGEEKAGGAGGVARGLGHTALHVACARGHTACARILLKAEQNPESVHVANGVGWTPLHSACSRDQSACARMLLTLGARQGAVTRSGMTALHLAVAYRSVHCVRLLTEELADASMTVRRREERGGGERESVCVVVNTPSTLPYVLNARLCVCVGECGVGVVCLLLWVCRAVEATLQRRDALN